MCDCPPDVKNAVTVPPAYGLALLAKTVTMTICDCDRRTCPVNGCYAKVDPPHGSRCINGHRS